MSSYKTTIALVGILGAASFGCKLSGNDHTPIANEPVPAPVVTANPTPDPEPVKKKTPAELILEKETLGDAITFAKPDMGDSSSVSVGAVLLGAWSMKNLSWADLNGLDSTEYKLVRKDPDEERGKKLCVSGRLIEISVQRTDYGKFSEGGMFSSSGNVTRFFAVKSTGNLVEGSPARFCGVVTGNQSYPNSGGGTTHAVYLVGMFDLPENKADK